GADRGGRRDRAAARPGPQPRGVFRAGAGSGRALHHHGRGAAGEETGPVRRAGDAAGMNALATLAASGAVIVLALLLPWLKFVLTIAMAKGIAVLGILLLLRAGQVSFGHAMYVAFAAYIVAFA